MANRNAIERALANLVRALDTENHFPPDSLNTQQFTLTVRQKGKQLRLRFQADQNPYLSRVFDVNREDQNVAA